MGVRRIDLETDKVEIDSSRTVPWNPEEPNGVQIPEDYVINGDLDPRLQEVEWDSLTPEEQAKRLDAVIASIPTEVLDDLENILKRNK